MQAVIENMCGREGEEDRTSHSPSKQSGTRNVSVRGIFQGLPFATGSKTSRSNSIQGGTLSASLHTNPQFNAH